MEKKKDEMNEFDWDDFEKELEKTETEGMELAVDEPIEEDVPVEEDEPEEVEEKPKKSKAVKKVSPSKAETKPGTVDGELLAVKISDIKVKSNSRKFFDEEKMNELTESIRNNGLTVPIILRRSGKEYELVAGERRLRACKNVELTHITAVVKEMDDTELLKANFIENINREDITPIEEAEAMKQMIDRGIYKNQSELAKSIGKHKNYITAKFKLLTLPEWLQNAINQKDITEWHGGSLSRLDDEREMKKVFKSVQANSLSVKATEDKVNKVLEAKGTKKESRNPNNKPKPENKIVDYINENLPENISVKIYNEGFVLSVNHNDNDGLMTLPKGLKYLSQNYKAIMKDISNQRKANFK